MVDTTSITSLIKAFRAETSKDSINPERLGSLLQKLADVLAQAASIADIGASTELADRLKKVANVLTALYVGSEDTKKIKLSYKTVSMTTGEENTFPDVIAIPSANSNKAGSMTAAHVRKLNENANNITSLGSSLSEETASRQSEDKAIRQSLTSLSGELTTLATNIKNVSDSVGSETASRQNADKSIQQSITNLSGELSSLAQQITNLSTRINSESSARVTGDSALSNRVTTLESSVKSHTSSINTLKYDQETTDHSISDLNSTQTKQAKQLATVETDVASLKKNDYTHIEAIVSDGVLTIPQAASLIARGLTPLIFRRTISQSRKSPDENNIREYMDKKHGWRLHYGEGKIKFENGVMQIRDDRTEHGADDSHYYTDPAILFKIRDEKYVGFGKRSYGLTTAHRFKFAVAFAKDPVFGKPFDFSCLRTNLATFRVYALYHMIGDKMEYIFSYSI